MIDVDTFNQSLGAEQALGADEQLVLYEQVRVMCTPRAVTVILEKTQARADALAGLFEIAGQFPGVLPFTTRSGKLAWRLDSEAPMDDTRRALDCLELSLQRFEIAPAPS